MYWKISITQQNKIYISQYLELFLIEVEWDVKPSYINFPYREKSIAKSFEINSW